MHCQSKLEKLKLGSDSWIAYRRILGDIGSLIFLPGFASSMDGTKAQALMQFCSANGIGITTFDYFGHGYSSGNFCDYGLSDWLNNCLEVIARLTDGPQIVVGSSMGGWLMSLLAIKVPDRVKALLGVAIAPDFTEELIFNKMTLAQKESLRADGCVDYIERDGECVYKISRYLIEDARSHLLLQDDEIAINCPIRLLHGINDQDVPYNTSLRFAKKVLSDDVEVRLLKSSAHNMSDPAALSAIYSLIHEMIEK